MQNVNNSPLSEDAAQVETWLNTQPNPTEQFKKYSFDEMKEALRKYLEPETESEGAIASEPAAPFEGDRQDLPWEKNGGGNYSVDTAKAKPVKSDQFDSLFNE